MSTLSSTLLWCALQTTLLSLLALVLGSRPWRFGGASAPLFGLIGVSLITLFAFLPIPWCWTTGLFDRQSATSLTTPSGSERKVAATYTTSSSADQGQLPLNAEELDNGLAYVTAFKEGLLASTEKTQTGWLRNPISTIVLGLFGTGIIIGTLRLIAGLVATRRLIRTCSLLQDQQLAEAMAVLQAKLGVKTLVVLYETDKLSTAATLGVVQPRILLPVHWREWTDEELSAVLAHELAHIAHGDFAAVMATQLSVVVHFYHPLVHWLASRLRLEQELAADSVAARIAGGQVRYVRVLAKLALEHQDRFVGWPARAFLPTRQTFLRRLEMLRDVQLTPSGRTPVGKWAAMVAIMVASVALVGLKPPPNRAMAQDTGAKPSASIGTVIARKLAEDRKAREAAKKRGELSFDDLKFEMEKGAKFKPEMLTQVNKDIDKKVWELRGFILPLTLLSRTGIKEFVLVRDNQQHCFGPGAALYDCVMVTMIPGETIEYATRIVTVKGKLEIDAESFQYPVENGHYAVYKMTAEEVK